MSKVKFGHGYVWKVDRNGNRKNVEDLNEALTEIAQCGPCGCDDCYGFETFINAETGELMIRYYTGTSHGNFTEHIELYDDETYGYAAVKALYLART